MSKVAVVRVALVAVVLLLLLVLFRHQLFRDMMAEECATIPVQQQGPACLNR